MGKTWKENPFKYKKQRFNKKKPQHAKQYTVDEPNDTEIKRGHIPIGDNLSDNCDRVDFLG